MYSTLDQEPGHYSRLYESSDQEELESNDKEYKAPDWKPLPWQREPYYNRKDKIILLCGGAGGGKSDLLAAKAHRFAMCYPGSFGLVLRKERSSMTTSIVPQMEAVSLGHCRHLPSKSIFIYPNGSKIYYTGMHTERERKRLRGAGGGKVDYGIMDEGIEFVDEHDMEEVLARMRGTAMGFNQLIVSTNPDTPMHWIYQRLILKGEATVYTSFAADNTYVTDDYRATMETYTGVYYDRMVKGLWTVAEGLVHSNWDPSIHIVSAENVLPKKEDMDEGEYIPYKDTDHGIPTDWKRIGSIDFGFTNPSVAQWWAVDYDGRMILYREIYQSELEAKDLADLILEYSQEEREAGVGIRWVADHAASERATLQRLGIKTKKASKGIEDGLNVVNMRLRKAADGKPRMMFLSDALITVRKSSAKQYIKQTTDEFAGYVWDKKIDGTILDKPKKVNDHGMDASRYAAVESERPKWTVV